MQFLISHFTARLSVLVVLTGLLAINGMAQTTSITDGMTPTGLKPGAPAGSYALSNFDNINLYNGSLSFQLPLLHVGGRGSAGYTMMLPFEQKWIVKKGQMNPSTGYTPLTPNPNWWQGIKPGYGPGVLQGRRSGHGIYSGSTYCGGVTNVFEQTLTRLTFTGADGTEYEFRDQLTGGAGSYVQQGAGCATTGPSRGTVFVANNGSGATFISDATIYDYKWLDINLSNRLIYPSGYLLLKDGTRYRIESGYVTWIRDRNGNKVTINGNTITDSLNRTITITPAAGATTYDEISFSGYPGYASGSRTIKVWYADLDDQLRSDFADTLTFYQLFPLNSASSSKFHPKRVSQVELPNGKYYRFYYNPYGELARVELPTGGAFEYDWDGFASTVADEEHIFRYVTERRVYNESGLETRTVYERELSGTVAPVEVKTYDSANHLLSLSKHYFEGDPIISLLEDPSRPSSIYFSPWKEGRELKTETFDIVVGSAVLKQTVENKFEQPLAGNSWPLGTAESSAAANPNNPQVTETKTTLADTNLVTKQTFIYDQYSNRTDTYEYNYGTGAAGSLVRRAHTDFLTTHPTTSVDYACDPGSTCGNSANLDNVIHLRSLPTQTQVFDGSGTEKARTTFEYDNYTASSPHAALTSYSNISGLCATVTVASGCVNTSPGSFSKRGNVTATSNYLLSASTSFTSYAQYDIAGNVVKTIDTRGNATDISYSDCYGAPDNNAQTNTAPAPLSSVSQASYALPTSVTNALGHTVYAQYDYNSGLVVNGKDANGVIAAGYYEDALDRPTQIRRAVGVSGLENQTTFAYNDTTRTVTTTSDRDANNDNLLVTKAIADGLGRTVETRQYESGSNYIAVKSIPFAVVQDGSNWRVVKQVSNPYRPYLSESAIWTTSISDSLGRVVKVITPDSATVTTNYSDNVVTVADQVGRSRKSVTDALGRLVQVYEDPGSSPHLNYLTSYEYDTLDNLTRVIQDNNPSSPVQAPRVFVYDSLKRLTSATDPESGTITYQYDEASNLLVKTDARGVSTHLQYDALNRLTRRTYNTNSSPSATTHSSSTTDQADFYYDAQTLPSNHPSYTPALTVGRLVAQTYGGSSSSTGDYFSYDELGRTITKFQRTGTVNYQTSATYNLAGGLLTLTYPSGHTVSYTYDAAARLTDMSGNLGTGGSSRTYSTATTYSAAGAISKEEFGTTTPVYNKSFYNSRGQLSEIRVSSTSGTDTSWNRGAIINHYSDNCWGMCGGSNSTTAMTDNNGNLLKQEVYIPDNDANSSYQMRWQQYDYDSLNRLKWARELLDGGSEQWKQIFVYDRYGNRTIDTTNTYGTGINKKDFTVDSATNRLGVPSGGTGVMQYDAAGNLTNDTYTGAGNRTYDAENKIISAWGGNNQAQLYAYDVGGNRIKRTVDGVVTTQVYGLGNELLAEYVGTSPSASSPSKEYGYRNGQLLIVGTAADSGDVANVSWTNTVGVSVSGNSLTSNVADNWGTSGASSTQSFASGDGYVELTASETTTYRMVGLSNGDSNQSYVDIDFAAYLYANTLCVYEAGTDRGCFGTFTTGDTIRVAVENGVVKYRKNGTLFYTSTISPTHPLKVDAALYSNGGTLNNVVIASNVTTASVNWLIADQLGTPRIILDESGSLANVQRHDYLPFGEELAAGISGRAATQGYGGGARLRQQFTSKERDAETNLDYFNARYYGSVQGRFTSADPLFVELKRLQDPQRLNIYAYSRNNPLKFIDPSGLDIHVTGDAAEDYRRRLQMNLSFQVAINKKGMVRIVDSNGKEMGKKALAKLGASLQGNQKELFNAITDKKFHVTIDTTSKADPGVDFGKFVGKGRNRLDFSDINLLDAPKNVGGLSAAQVVGHETLEAYAATQLGATLPDIPHRVANEFFGGLESPIESSVEPNIVDGNILSISGEFPVHNSPTGARAKITRQFLTPIPVSSLPLPRGTYVPAHIANVEKKP